MSEENEEEFMPTSAGPFQICTARDGYCTCGLVWSSDNNTLMHQPLDINDDVQIPSDEQRLANAQLFAASWDLQRALELMLEERENDFADKQYQHAHEFDDELEEPSDITYAREALAKSRRKRREFVLEQAGSPPVWASVPIAAPADTTPVITNDVVKQVIVVRADLKMRRGKEIAQGAHASMAFLSHKVRHGARHDHSSAMETRFALTHCENEWLKGRFTKIAVSVDSEEALEDVYQKALNAGIPAYLITDSGLTEFNGVPTKTACGIGPYYASKIDEITGKLPLR